MAVEARCLSTIFSSPQTISKRDVMNPVEANGGFYNAYGYGAVPLLSETTTGMEANVVGPLNGFGSDFNGDSLMNMRPTMKWIESALACNNGNVATTTSNLLQLHHSRKRSRDCAIIDPAVSPPSFPNSPPCAISPLSLLGQDIGMQVQQQQMDVDRLISHHMERVRMEMEEKRKIQARRIVEAIEQGLVKRLKAKEEESENMGKLNHALEERVRSLAVENQFLRDLAQTNEATANALRANLEQVLAQVREGGERLGDGGDVVEDAESYCERGAAAAEADWKGKRLCRVCGEEEPCVLILPCRHLCLCAACGPAAHACPVCWSAKNASVHVNLSSS